MCSLTHSSEDGVTLPAEDVLPPKSVQEPRMWLMDVACTDLPLALQIILAMILKRAGGGLGLFISPGYWNLGSWGVVSVLCSLPTLAICNMREKGFYFIIFALQFFAQRSHLNKEL